MCGNRRTQSGQPLWPIARILRTRGGHQVVKDENPSRAPPTRACVAALCPKRVTAAAAVTVAPVRAVRPPAPAHTLVRPPVAAERQRTTRLSWDRPGVRSSSTAGSWAAKALQLLISQPLEPYKYTVIKLSHARFHT